MASEGRVQSGLTITKRSSDNSMILLDYMARPASFSVDVNGLKGPTPGSLQIPVGGEIVNLGELVTPGLVRLMNCDETNYVEYGIYDPGIGIFYPFGELGPGESYILKFSRNLLEEFVGTGTGTTSAGNRFFMKANTAPCVVLVDAFEA